MLVSNTSLPSKKERDSNNIHTHTPNVKSFDSSTVNSLNGASYTHTYARITHICQMLITNITEHDFSNFSFSFVSNASNPYFSIDFK